jgi:hypothetical protein
MNFLVAFILALLISLGFSRSYRGESSGMPVIFMFILLVLAGLAAQYWVMPFGPIVWGIAWMPLVATVLIFTVLLIMPSPYQGRKAREKKEVIQNEVKAAATISVFMWLLLFLLSVAVLVGYFRNPIMNPL